MGPAVSSHSQADLRSTESGRPDASRSLEKVFAKIMRMLDLGLAPNYADDDRRALVEICDVLKKLAQRKWRGRDAWAIENAVLALEKLVEIQDNFEVLNLELAEIDKLHAVEEAEDPNQKSKIDLLASAFSLQKVCDFSAFCPQRKPSPLEGRLGRTHCRRREHRDVCASRRE